MIKTVIREHHYRPVDIDRLFLDNIDYHGLEWLHNDIADVNEQIEKASEANKPKQSRKKRR